MILSYMNKSLNTVLAKSTNDVIISFVHSMKRGAVNFVEKLPSLFDYSTGGG